MSAGLAVALMVAGVVVIGAVWIVVTRRSRRLAEPEPELAVVWMRPRHAWFAHAFHVAELGAGLPEVEPVAWCGRRPVGELLADDEVSRCAACERAVARMHRRRE